MYVFAIIGGVIAGWRIWQNLKSCASARTIPGTRASSTSCVSAARIRSSRTTWISSSLFPTREAAEQLAAQLTTEGFDADMIDTPENGDLRYSLHAHKSMQLTVPDMQEPEPAPDRHGHGARGAVRRLEREAGAARSPTSVRSSYFFFSVCFLTASAAALMASGSPR